MTDAQIVSIAITVFAIAAGSIFNNLRISDLSSPTGNRFNDMRDLFRAENARTQDKLDAIIRLLGELDTRVTHLEQKIH